MPEEAMLVLFAHGSRDPRWRRPFERMAEELARELGAARVRLAFMEFWGPRLVDVAQDALRHRIHRLRVLPVFLAGGAHVAKDLPEQVATLRARFPSLSVEVLAPAGEDPRVGAALRQVALEAAAS